MALRERRLLEHASTLSGAFIEQSFHTVWAITLGRIAASIPDTHGLMICKVRARFPVFIRKQLSPNYTSWPDFCNAICGLRYGIVTMPESLPIPWFKHPTAGNLVYDLPSNTQLAVRLNRYMPATWRGIEPDRRLPANIPPAPDNAWEDPIPIPPALHHSIHGDIFSPVAPASLASPAPTKSTAVTSPAVDTPSSASAKGRGKQTKDSTPSKPKKKKKITTQASNLLAFGFRQDKIVSAPPCSMAGISSHLASLGLKKVKPKKPKDCTKRDVDHSMYLWPSYLFPALTHHSTPYDAKFTDLDLGLELVGIEYDPRSIILDLKACFLEIEPLLHTSPQFFSNEEWTHVARIPAKQRGFKVVIALQLKTHTFAWLSMDNLCYIYWFSRIDMDAARPGRVPDVILDHWKWSEYTVEWLKEQDMNPKWDTHSFAEVLLMPKNHPMRGVGRYSSDEISARSGVPLWTLWRDVCLNPKLLCAVLETFFLSVLERYCAIPEFLSPSYSLNKLCGKDSNDTDSSFLIISTKESVLRYSRMLSVHKRQWCYMSQRKKRLVLQYNRLSCQSHISTTTDAMKNAPWPFDLADLAPAVLLFGHLGPAIVDNWDSMYNQEAVLATTAEMRDLYRKLPATLTQIQRLSLKPMVDLTSDEKSLLIATYGSTTNPIVRYFQTRSTIFDRAEVPPPPPRCPPEAGTKAGTIFRMEQKETGGLNDGVDGVLDLEAITNLGALDADMVDDVDSLLATSENPNYEPGLLDADPGLDADPRLNVMDVGDEVDSQWIDEPLTLVRDGPKFGSKCPTLLCKSHTKPGFYAWTVLKPLRSTTIPPKLWFIQKSATMSDSKKTLKAIKENMRLYTVGPLDFCGHAKAIQLGKGWVIALCQWDSTLSHEDQLFMKRSWDSIVRKLLKDNWTLAREIQEADVDREVACQRKMKRDLARQKELQKSRQEGRNQTEEGMQIEKESVDFF
ncbi:hypothetical protein B0H14DRAFT_2604459 [Mycena olivaceomarginata]|nr:hypothetical protein B0H14DRAFT_2604459 [Mycena olivaceomarginata]